jgi:hypothetical protein
MVDVAQFSALAALIIDGFGSVALVGASLEKRKRCVTCLSRLP